MKAVVMVKRGGPEVLRFMDFTDPALRGQRDLLVRIRACGVNPIDTKQRKRGTVFGAAPPQILGCDCAGVVVKKGEGVRRFDVGDELFFMHGGIGREQGTYAEYTVIDERFAARKPASRSFAEAAAAPLGFLTAWESLFERGDLKEGKKVLIHAGAGGVGHIAVQLAKLHGAEVCTTVSDEEKKAFVAGLGADKVVLYKDEEFVDQALEWTDGRGVDVALDTVGGETLFKTFSCVRLYGKVVTLLGPQGEGWQQARHRNIELALEWVLTPMYYEREDLKEHHAELLVRCAELMDQGKLKCQVSRTFRLDQASSAHTEIEKGHTSGKVVIAVE